MSGSSSAAKSYYELQVPEWQELAVGRRKRRKMLKSTDIV
jgi:hypothetical protein